MFSADVNVKGETLNTRDSIPSNLRRRIVLLTKMIQTNAIRARHFDYVNAIADLRIMRRDDPLRG